MSKHAFNMAHPMVDSAFDFEHRIEKRNLLDSLVCCYGAKIYALRLPFFFFFSSLANMHAYLTFRFLFCAYHYMTVQMHTNLFEGLTKLNAWHSSE